ncbi:MAG: TonB-dependent receptor, partial [Acidobacteria bacterium]|nr:TonB-dependent receptor [Acidobacteriota bacterium]
LEYDTKALMLEGTDLTLYGERNAAGYLNFAHPIAVPLPRWKSRWSASYDWGNQMLSNYVSYISAYEDFGADIVPTIDPFLTWDISFLWRFPASGLDLTLYALNLTGQIPPWVNVEQGYDGFTHDPKGRRLKMALRYRFGG